MTALSQPGMCRVPTYPHYSATPISSSAGHAAIHAAGAVWRRHRPHGCPLRHLCAGGDAVSPADRRVSGRCQAALSPARHADAGPNDQQPRLGSHRTSHPTCNGHASKRTPGGRYPASRRVGSATTQAQTCAIAALSEVGGCSAAQPGSGRRNPGPGPAGADRQSGCTALARDPWRTSFGARNCDAEHRRAVAPTASTPFLPTAQAEPLHSPPA